MSTLQDPTISYAWEKKTFYQHSLCVKESWFVFFLQENIKVLSTGIETYLFLYIYICSAKPILDHGFKISLIDLYAFDQVQQTSRYDRMALQKVAQVKDEDTVIIA